MGQKNAVQIQAVVNGQLGVCTVHNGALQCSVNGQAPASANGQGAVAVGVGAQANGTGTMAYGQNAQARYDGSVAIGSGAQANADPTTAVGNNAIANGNNSVALGANTVANGNNSVALGQGSVANRANSVSVGNVATGLARQITNVAPGTAGTDAVNVNQLEQATAGALGQAKTYAAAAAAAAMAQTAPQLLPGQHDAVAAKVGYFDGQSAIGASYAHLLNRHALGTFSLSATQDGQVGASAGVQFGW